jgi:hypothetical protein
MNCDFLSWENSACEKKYHKTVERMIKYFGDNDGLFYVVRCDSLFYSNISVGFNWPKIRPDTIAWVIINGIAANLEYCNDKTIKNIRSILQYHRHEISEEHSVILRTMGYEL